MKTVNDRLCSNKHLFRHFFLLRQMTRKYEIVHTKLCHPKKFSLMQSHSGNEQSKHKSTCMPLTLSNNYIILSRTANQFSKLIGQCCSSHGSSYLMYLEDQSTFDCCQFFFNTCTEYHGII